MEKLRKQHNVLLNRVSFDFERYISDKLPWDSRLMGIRGARGVGKTTLLLQKILKMYSFSEEALYISLDNIYFSNNRLVDLAEDFVSKGGKHIFIDEVHKYKDWSIEFKNIYDQHTDLKVTFTGSSLLHILDSRVDLSRRALSFNLKGLSFREYLNFVLGTDFEQIDLKEILNNHIGISLEIIKEIKPLKYYEEYLRWGYFPFFIEDKDYFFQRLEEIVNMIIDIELPLLRSVDPAKTIKIKQLLFIIAQSSPFKPNISKLAERIEVTRNTMNEYIKILADAKLISLLNKNAIGINLLQKPDKVFLENTNLAFAISNTIPDKGNLRETFFYNQISEKHMVSYPDNGDFLVDETFLFEIGGRNKTVKQIAGIDNAYIVSDDIELGYKNKIPIWLFGFLY